MNGSEAVGYSETANAAVGYANLCSRSHDAVIRVYDATGNVIETYDHVGEFDVVLLIATAHPANRCF